MRWTLWIDVGIGLAKIGKELLASWTATAQRQRGYLAGRLMIHFFLRAVAHRGIHALIDALKDGHMREAKRQLNVKENKPTCSEEY